MRSDRARRWVESALAVLVVGWLVIGDLFTARADDAGTAPPVPQVVAMMRDGHPGFWVPSADFRRLDQAERLFETTKPELDALRAALTARTSEAEGQARNLARAAETNAILSKAWTDAEASLTQCLDPSWVCPALIVASGVAGIVSGAVTCRCN